MAAATSLQSPLFGGVRGSGSGVTIAALSRAGISGACPAAVAGVLCRASPRKH
jgi:hypothetical protein